MRRGPKAWTSICLIRSGSAQTITGSTTIDIDPDTGQVTVICETDPDDSTEAYYQASVTCTVYGNGTLIGRKIGTVTRSGSATAAFAFAGVPGTTYTATGTHGATISYLDEDFSDTLAPADFYDAYNFSSFESPLETYPDTYDWFGPGPPEGWTTSSVQTGNTTATASVGIQLYATLTDCSHPNSDGSVPYTVQWGNQAPPGGCQLGALAGNFQPNQNGGSCVSIGTLHFGGPLMCWQVVSNGCNVTTCGSQPRYVNNACTKFVDATVPTTTTHVPVGCTP